MSRLHTAPRVQNWWAPGYPLLPQPYRAAWVDEPLPGELIAEAGLPADMTLGRLDQHVWVEADHPDRLGAVADHVAALFTQRVHRRPRSPLAERRIAAGPWPPDLDPRQLPFSLRTRSLLERHGRLDDTDWLTTTTAGDLGALRLCGPLTVLEVAAVLEHHLVPRSDPHPRADLEAALTHIVRGVIAERNVVRMLRRLGWDGGGGCTLQAVAAEAGVTRERIRQIESALLTRLHAETRVPVLDRAIQALDEAVRGGRHADGAQVLLDARLTSRPFLPYGVLSAARVFDRPVGFEVDADGRTIRRPIPPDLSGAMFEALLDLRRRIGHVASVGEFLAAVQAAGRATDEDSVRQFLERRQRLEWLDAEHSWFWIRQPAGRNRLEQDIRKVLSVCGRVEAGTLVRALARNPRAWPRPIPTEAVVGLCLATGLCVEDGMVSSRVPIDPAEALGPNELLVVKKLQDRGGALSMTKLRCGTEVPPGALNALLAQSPLLERTADDVVRLVGAAPG